MALAEKISISLTAEDLAWAKQRAKRDAKSLSAVLSEALHRHRQAEARARLLSELGTRDISEADRDHVRDEWRAPPRARVKSSRQSKRAKKR